MIKFFKGEKVNENEEISLDMEKIPKHVAIIMDGNGRWAKKRKLPRTMGHKAGVETIRKILREADAIGIKYMTLYAFSTENWKRPKDEVGAIMKLLVHYLRQEIKELHENGVKINVLGDIKKLPRECIEEIDKAVEKTKNNTGVQMNIALNYGGRDEIITSVKAICEKVKNGELAIEDIDESVIEDNLYTRGVPDPDIIIRPSGEQRLSNFLLWQCAYSEFWYSNICWPDFGVEDLHRAIYDYQQRDRRYGGIKK